MTLTRWWMGLGIVVALGFLQVSQQTTIRLAAYALGRREAHVHALENKTQWLAREVVELQSPARLAAAMKDARTEWLAWSALPPAPAVMPARSMWSWAHGRSRQRASSE